MRAQFHCQSTGGFTRLYPASTPDYQLIKQVLDELNIEHFLFPELNASLLKVVIRGLPTNMDVEQIQSDLNKKSLPVIKVAQMASFRTKNKLPLY